MTDPTDATRPPTSVPGIDPRGWIEPKETFPGEVIVSAYRECDPKYMEPNQYRTVKLPRPVWQWDLRVKRLDAVFQLPDGSRADVVRYGGYDLERWNNRTGEIEPINLRSNKEALMGGAWVQVFGTIEPPESLVGKKALFEFYPSKRVGRNVAKNILLPLVPALAPDYAFTGEVQVFVVTRDQDGTAPNVTQDGATTANLPQTSVVLSEDDAFAQLPALLDGLNRTDVAGIINKLPANLRHGTVINGIINGSAFTDARLASRITIAADGTITGTDLAQEVEAPA